MNEVGARLVIQILTLLAVILALWRVEMIGLMRTPKLSGQWLEDGHIHTERYFGEPFESWASRHMAAKSVLNNL